MKKIRLNNEGKEAVTASFLGALITKGYVVRWWKRRQNGEWKKQKEKVVFDNLQSIFRFAERKKKKGFIVQVEPLHQAFPINSGPIY